MRQCDNATMEHCSFMTAKEFLIWYKRSSKKYADRFLAKWQKEAKICGKISDQMIKKFADLYPRGKQFRGALMVLGYQIAGGKDLKEILKASIFIELFHTAILICDDVFDRDEVRRGSPTIHEQWRRLATRYLPRAISQQHYGNSMGVNTGIMGFYLAQIPLLQANFPLERKHKALLEFSRFAIRLIWGEGMDISSNPASAELNLAASVAKIHQFKTVEYTGIMPLRIGGILANASQQKLKLLEKYGEILGRAFQIQDDIIGSFGDPKKTGKSNLSDIADGRWTVLLEILWGRTSKRDKQLLKKIFEKSKRGNKEIKQVKDLMVKYKVVNLARQRAERYLKEGLAVISRVTKNKRYQETMEELLKFMLSRTK